MCLRRRSRGEPGAFSGRAVDCIQVCILQYKTEPISPFMAGFRQTGLSSVFLFCMPDKNKGGHFFLTELLYGGFSQCVAGEQEKKKKQRNKKRSIHAGHIVAKHVVAGYLGRQKYASMDLSGITHVAFDADDTLWAHENIFVDAKARCLKLLSPYMKEGMNLEEELYRFERKNLKIFGYGVKGFTLSMIETAIELSDGKISGAEIQQVIDLAKEMLNHPINLLPGVETALDALENHYTLMAITKGDLFDQENKLARSGVGDYFEIVEIVSEKTADTYRDIFRRHKIDPSGLIMIGNSLKSDVLPVIEAGARAAHLPFEYTWHHEAVTETKEEYWKPDSMDAFMTGLLGAVEGSAY